MKKTIKWKVAQTAELQWWKNYLKDKDTAEYLNWKKNYWNELLSKVTDVIKPKNGDSILDAGCGPAGVFTVLNHCQVDAVDPLVDEYEKNLKHFRKTDYPFTSFHSLPFEDFETEKKYDIVFCMNAINHVSDLKKSFDKLIGLLKSNGLLVITIDAHNFSIFKFIFRLLPGDILHPHQYDITEYEKMIKDRNCGIIKQVKLKHEFFFNHYLLVGKKSISKNLSPVSFLPNSQPKPPDSK